MPQINQLSPVSQVSSSDQIPVYATQNGDARKMSVSQLLDYFEESFVTPDTTVDIQTISPGAAGTYAVTPSTAQVIWFRIQALNSLLGATSIILPDAASTADGTEILITTTQRINTFAVTSLGGTVLGVPTDMTANSSVRMRLHKSSLTWYNITANSTSFAAPLIGIAQGQSLSLSAGLNAATVQTSGNALVGGTLGVTSNATIGGTLNVGAAGVFSGNVSGASGTFPGGALSSATVSTTGSATIGTTLDVTGLITGNASILANSSSSRVGYGTSAGGAVVQATNKSTAVTLNNPTGQVTMNNAALNAGVSVSFDINSTSIFANDIIVINYISGAADPFAYTIIGSCQSNKAVITVKNISAGNLSEAIVFKFAIIAGDV